MYILHIIFYGTHVIVVVDTSFSFANKSSCDKSRKIITDQYFGKNRQNGVSVNPYEPESNTDQKVH